MRVASKKTRTAETNPRAISNFCSKRMTNEQIEELVVALLRIKSVRLEAVRLLKPEHFSKSQEMYLALLWTQVLALDPEYSDAPAIPYHVLYSHCKEEAIDPGMGFTRDQYDQLLATDRDVDPDDWPGILYHAYKVVKSSQLDADFGIKRLKRFLKERVLNEPIVSQIMEASHRGLILDNPSEFIASFGQLQGQVATIGRASSSLAGRQEEFEARLALSRGRKLLGLRTGLDTLDRMLDGLRDVTVLAAPSNTGKTVLVVQLGVGVARHAENDCAVVVISLDMETDDLHARVLSHLSQLPHRVLIKGSPELRGQPEGPHLNKDDSASYKAGRARMKEIGGRFFLYGEDDIGGELTALRMRQIMDEVRKRAGTTRVLLVLDYLQLIDTPEEISGDDLAADKYRIAAVREAVKPRPGIPLHERDAALIVSETRKRISNPKQHSPMANDDVMGSARTVYRAGCVMLLSPMADDQMRRVYEISTNNPNGNAKHPDCEAHREFLKHDQHLSPMTLEVTKGRDGMERGSTFLEFHFQTSTMTPIEPKPISESANLQGAAASQAVIQRRERVVNAFESFPKGEPASLNKIQAKIRELNPNHTPNKGTLKKDLAALVKMGRVLEVPTAFNNQPVIWYSVG